MVRMESFVMHPLFIRIESDSSCVSHNLIPDASAYRICRPIHTYDTSHSLVMIEQSLKKWLDRRHIKLLCPQIGIIDIDKKILYMVDILAEHEDDVVFLVIHASKSRCCAKQKEHMLAHCSNIKSQTHKIFKFEPTVFFINIYAQGKISSTLIQSRET